MTGVQAATPVLAARASALPRPAVQADLISKMHEYADNGFVWAGLSIQARDGPSQVSSGPVLLTGPSQDQYGIGRPSGTSSAERW